MSLNDPMKTAFVFPGQGSQIVGMGKELAENSTHALSVFNEVNDALDQNLSSLMFEGPIEDLTLTFNAQPALMASSMAIVRVLEKEFGLRVGDVATYMAGHSLGEYSALVASGSIDFKTALNLVYKRGLFMEKSDAGSMFAILNLDIETIYSICDEVRDTLDEIVAPANINSANQVVIAGSHESAALAAEKCKVAGAKRTIQLKVSVASHCNLMQSASILLSEEMKNIKFNNPTIPIIHNVDALEGNNDDDIAQKLTDQLIKPVQLPVLRHSLFWKLNVTSSATFRYREFMDLGSK